MQAPPRIKSAVYPFELIRRRTNIRRYPVKSSDMYGILERVVIKLLQRSCDRTLVTQYAENKRMRCRFSAPHSPFSPYCSASFFFLMAIHSAPPHPIVDIISTLVHSRILV